MDTSRNLQLNDRAATLCDQMLANAAALQIASEQSPCGTRLIDCGINTPGSRDAGLLLARVCLADWGEVAILPADPGLGEWPVVGVKSAEPVAACLAAQYAGWELKGEKFFGMGSGPMRAAAAREPLFEILGYQERASRCVGVVEAAKLPPEEICRDIAAKCAIDPADLTLLVAPTASICGTLQIVARSLETALHKLHEVGFDLSAIFAGSGTAPLPPVAEDDLAAIGVTNDAILYGGSVRLQVRCEDAQLELFGQRVPSETSTDYGRPFAEVLAEYNHDFYQVDPLLFSPAWIEFENLATGSTYSFGNLNPEVLARSFASVSPPPGERE